MSTPSLNIAVKDVLDQGRTFLDRVSDQIYARRLEGPFAASLGAHYRHVLDHFLCLAEGIRTGQVNYDQRRRNPQLESSVAYARLVTDGLIEDLGGLAREVLQRECTVTYSVGYVDSDAEPVRSKSCARSNVLCRTRHSPLRTPQIAVWRGGSEPAL